MKLLLHRKEKVKKVKSFLCVIRAHSRHADCKPVTYFISLCFCGFLAALSAKQWS